jgi:hypothetical protein
MEGNMGEVQESTSWELRMKCEGDECGIAKLEEWIHWKNLLDCFTHPFNQHSLLMTST